MTGTAITRAAPPIPDDLDAVLRRMRFPYLRKAAPGVLATARAQRWDPAEVVRILLEEEIRGRRSRAADPPQSRRAPRREDVRVLARRQLLHPAARPACPDDLGMGHPRGESLHRRHVRYPRGPDPADPLSSMSTTITVTVCWHRC